MTEAELREQAIKKLEEKREFKQHAAIYLLVNAALVFIWFTTNNGGYFWPVWPMFGWGIGIVAHAFQAYGMRPLAEADIEREMKRLVPPKPGSG